MGCDWVDWDLFWDDFWFLTFSIKFLEDNFLLILEFAALASWFWEGNECAIQWDIQITLLHFRIIPSLIFLTIFPTRPKPRKGAILNPNRSQKVFNSLFLMFKAGRDMNIIGFKVIIFDRLIPCADTSLFLEWDFVGCKINYGLIECKEWVVVEKGAGELLGG